MKAPQLFKTLTVTVLACVLAHAASAKPAVYVADFFTRDREITPLTMKLTGDFEIALGGTNKYDILERRDFDKLRAEAKNEAAIAEVSGLPGELVSALKTKNAEMVVFGEVFDDVDSGQVSVTVSFVTFSGEKKLLLNAKIPRGKINDGDTRTAAMDELVKRIVTSSRKVVQLELNGVLFQVVRCRASDRVVTIDLLVTDNEEDKDLTLYADSNSSVYDNNGNRTGASSGRLANVVANGNNWGQLRMPLISGVPVKAALEFQGVSSTAESIARVDIKCWESLRQKDFWVSFRNLPIER